MPRLGGLLAALLLTAAPVYAQTYPDVRGLAPYSAETNFMSLSGYLRWLVFHRTGRWVSYADAVRILQQLPGR